jgi:dipeptidyl-peptidase-4
MKRPTPRFSHALAASLISASLLAGCSGSQPAATRPANSGGPAQVAASSIADNGFLEAFAITNKFTLGRPKSFEFTPDGSSLLFLRSQARNFQQDLFEFNCTTGQERVLLTAEAILGGGEEKLTAEELARRERMRMTSRGISSYALSKDGTRILVPLSGKLFVVDRASGKRTELKTNSKAFPIDPRFSPDGSLVACVRDGEVFITDSNGDKEWKVTTGAGGTITNGLAEFVAQEEMSRFRGYWFSPDSRLLCFQQTDTKGMEQFTIPDPADPAKTPETWPYPRTGTKNADVKLAITSVAGGPIVWVQWDREKYPYVATVNWTKNAPLTVLVQNRAQTEQVLMAVDEKTGATTALLTDRDPAWINIHESCPKWLEDGSGFLWVNENSEGAKPGSDFARLELRNRDGSLNKVLTPPGFPMLDLVALDNVNGAAFISAATTPTRTQVARVSLKGGSEPVMIADAPGSNSVTFSENFETRLESSNLASGKLTWTVKRSDTSVVGEIASKAEQPPFVPNLEMTRVGNLVGQERNFYAAIVRPRNFEKGRKYPVIVSVYGGPGSNTVNDTPMSYLLQQWYADHGFIVVSIDGRGTPRRGRAWERAIHLNLIDLPLADQAQALSLLGSRYPEMDLKRVGMTGWSFGGYFSAMATMRMPKVFHAGVAGAPVCDFQDYDTHYTERFMGMPSENVEGYKASNVLTYCKDLTVPLLIVHGTADDNVYFVHSLKMASELFRNGRHFEFLPLAGFTHVVAEPQTVNRLQQRIMSFFTEHLSQR